MYKELGHLTSIIIQEKAPQTCPQAYLMKACFNPDDSSLCQSDQKKKKKNLSRTSVG